MLLPVAFWLFLVVAIVNGIAGNAAWRCLPLALVVSIVAGTLYQGMVVGLVRDVQDGRRDSSVGELFGFGHARCSLPLIGAGILSGLGIGVGLVLLIVPGLILLTIWAVIAPAIVIERAGVFDAFGRSRELVRGYGWPVFWRDRRRLLITVVGGIVFGDIAAGISDGPILRIVFSALASTITAPIGALVAAILYYRLLASLTAPRRRPRSIPPNATDPAGSGRLAPPSDAPRLAASTAAIRRVTRRAGRRRPGRGARRGGSARTRRGGDGRRRGAARRSPPPRAARAAPRASSARRRGATGGTR